MQVAVADLPHDEDLVEDVDDDGVVPDDLEADRIGEKVPERVGDVILVQESGQADRFLQH